MARTIPAPLGSWLTAELLSQQNSSTEQRKASRKMCALKPEGIYL